MTIFAVVSDIHGNYEALTAVLAHARQVTGLSHVPCICLGDVVDYGPRPNECMDWAATIEYVVQGNHDREVARRVEHMPPAIHEEFWPITLWTQAVLAPAHKERIRAWPECLAVTALPDTMVFHSGFPPEAAVDVIIDSVDQAQRTLRALAERGARYGLFGHSHIQGYFTLAGPGAASQLHLTSPLQHWPGPVVTWQPVPLATWIELPAGGALINPGSVGQPRLHSAQIADGIGRDARAAYSLVRATPDQNLEVQFHRAPYKCERTRTDLGQIRWPPSALPPELPLDFPGAQQLRAIYDHIDEHLHALVPLLQSYLPD